jgi:hypothetical protein
VRSELIALLVRAAGSAGTAGGQCLDLEADKLGMPEQPNAAHVERLQGMRARPAPSLDAPMPRGAWGWSSSVND